MALYENYPYTNFHELNLDWIIKLVKKVVDEWDNFNSRVDAEAFASVDPSVTVTGDLQEGLTFTFGLPRGAQGAAGPAGQDGVNGVSIQSASVDASGHLILSFDNGTTLDVGEVVGPAGEGLKILGEYSTLAALQAAHPTGSAGDAYMVGSGGSYTLYIWDTDSSAWTDVGSLTSPSPSSTSPKMDGIATVGVEQNYARGDHIHPSDTSKQNALTTGALTINGQAIGGSAAVDLLTTSNVKTIASQPIVGSGNLTLADIGAQARLTSGAVKVNGTTIGSLSQDVDILTTTALSEINGNSIQTGTDLSSSDLGLQDQLVSGTNIKTLNGTSLLGNGNIQVVTVYSGSGDPSSATGVDGDLYLKYSS